MVRGGMEFAAVMTALLLGLEGLAFWWLGRVTA
jgi:hypothetical protein